MTVDPRCKNCTYWLRIDHPRNTKGWGNCHWIEGDYLQDNNLESDDAFITMPYGYEGSFITGPEFGCVQFEERDNEPSGSE